MYILAVERAFAGLRARRVGPDEGGEAAGPRAPLPPLPSHQRSPGRERRPQGK